MDSSGVIVYGYFQTSIMDANHSGISLSIFLLLLICIIIIGGGVAMLPFENYLPIPQQRIIGRCMTNLCKTSK